MRLRCPRRKVQEVLLDLFGLELSVGLIEQTVLEAERAAEFHDEVLTRNLLETTLARNSSARSAAHCTPQAGRPHVFPVFADVG